MFSFEAEAGVAMCILPTQYKVKKTLLCFAQPNAKSIEFVLFLASDWVGSKKTTSKVAHSLLCSGANSKLHSSVSAK